MVLADTAVSDVPCEVENYSWRETNINFKLFRIYRIGQLANIGDGVLA